MLVETLEYSEILESEQFKSLLEIARIKKKHALEKVGTPIEGEPNQKYLLYVDYSEDKCIKKVDKYGLVWWDIPSYSNGSTRHAKSLFRIGNTCIGDGYCVCVDNDMSYYDYIKDESETEKILMTEYFDMNLVELVWTWDWRPWKKEAKKNGSYFIVVGEFYIALKINGKIVQKLDKHN